MLLNAQSNSISISNRSITENGVIDFSEDWYVESGDSFEWISDTTIHLGWEKYPSQLSANELEALDWKGYGWFKKEIRIDSALIGKPVFLVFENHIGASQIYLDNTLVFTLGEFSRLPEDNNVQLYENEPIILVLNDTNNHLLSIRFGNHTPHEFLEFGLLPGFNLKIVSREYFSTSFSQLKSSKGSKIYLIIGLLSTLTIVHFLFLIFYPAGQKNFYFVLFAGGVTVFSTFNNPEFFTTSPDWILFFKKGEYVAWLGALFGFLRFSYSFQKNSTPIQLNILLVIGIGICITQIFRWAEINVIQSVFTLLVFLEVFRIFLKAKFNLKQPSEILIWGTVTFFIIISYSLLNTDDFKFNGFELLNNLVAITLLVFSVSAYLLKDFAKAQIRLEYKFLEVKHLSERSVNQERKSKEKEIEQKILEKENERKTAELEEARALQISMLPAKYPDTEFWDIAAYMEPSQEVGGDYYDFSLDRHNILTVALGDATGHGMKAGIIVATAKSYFHSLVADNSLIEIIKKMSLGIRNMDIKMMYMGLMLLKCKEHSITFTSGGMPPALLYRKELNSIEQVLLKAMPLGTNINFPYKELSYELQSGDIFLLLSDGLMELFDKKREHLGMDRIAEELQKNSDKSAANILEEIKKLQQKWSGEMVQEDDVTVLVLKAK